MNRAVGVILALILGMAGFLGNSSLVLAGPEGRTQVPATKPGHTNALSTAQRINQALIHYGFIGSVLVAQHGKILLTHGYGRSGLRASAPRNTARTVYNADNLTVPLTASALLQLQEKGKLSVGDSMCKYLSSCPAYWRPITIENLLDCTSGIYDPIIEDNTFKPTPRTTTAQYLARAAAHPLSSSPDIPDRGPCDTEPIIAGSIVQTVSGQSFPSYIEQHVLQPAALIHSGILQANMRVPGMATPYGAGHTAPAGWIDGQWSYGLTGLYTTVSDVYTWDEALMGGEIISQTSLKVMMKKHGQGSPYGWGLYASYVGKRLLVASGETPWSTEVNAVVPSTNTVIIFLSNTETNSPSYVTPILGLLKT